MGSIFGRPATTAPACWPLSVTAALSWRSPLTRRAPAEPHEAPPSRPRRAVPGLVSRDALAVRDDSSELAMTEH